MHLCASEKMLLTLETSAGTSPTWLLRWRASAYSRASRCLRFDLCPCIATQAEHSLALHRSFCQPAMLTPPLCLSKSSSFFQTPALDSPEVFGLLSGRAEMPSHHALFSWEYLQWSSPLEQGPDAVDQEGRPGGEA